MDVTIPAVLKTVIDRINGNRGLGLAGLLANWDLFSRAGALVECDGFLAEFLVLVENRECALAQPAAKLSASDRKREARRAFWAAALTEYFGFQVEVPFPPALNRRQERMFKRYGFLMAFLPGVSEDQFPAGAVKPDWRKYFDVRATERIPLRGRWVAVETIRKPDYVGKKYPNDALMSDIGVESRFGHPYSGKGEGDDVVEDILPKVAAAIGFDAKRVMLPSVEEWNLVGNLFDWLRHNRDMSELPDLGATNAWEWCRNSCGSGYGLFAGDCKDGGLSAVYKRWHCTRCVSAAFRVLVVL